MRRVTENLAVIAVETYAGCQKTSMRRRQGVRRYVWDMCRVGGDTAAIAL